MEENKINPNEEQAETEASTEAAPEEPVAETASEPATESETPAEPEVTAVPAPEPEAAPEEPVAETAPEPEAAPEAPVTETAPEPEAAPEEPVAETAPEPEAAPEPDAAPEEPVAEAAPAPEAAPAQPAKRTRSRRHVPRSERRKRTAKVQAKKPAKPGALKPIVRLPKPETERGNRQERRGVVVSAAMEKTIVVKVDTIKAHRKYGKVMRRSKKYHAHDEENSAKVGDVVRIVETRPLSATKCWRVVEILEVAK